MKRNVFSCLTSSIWHHSMAKTIQIETKKSFYPTIMAINSYSLGQNQTLPKRAMGNTIELSDEFIVKKKRQQ